MAKNCECSTFFYLTVLIVYKYVQKKLRTLFRECNEEPEIWSEWYSISKAHRPGPKMEAKAAGRAVYDIGGRVRGFKCQPRMICSDWNPWPNVENWEWWYGSNYSFNFRLSFSRKELGNWRNGNWTEQGWSLIFKLSIARRTGKLNTQSITTTKQKYNWKSWNHSLCRSEDYWNKSHSSEDSSWWYASGSSVFRLWWGRSNRRWGHSTCIAILS